MHNPLIQIGSVAITGWQIVGLVGTLLFSGRWILQVFQSHKAKASVVSRGFWYMSISGNALVLVYFIFGNTDGIGILSNSFPIVLATYNLRLIAKKEKTSQNL